MKTALNDILLVKYKTCGIRAKHTYNNIAEHFCEWLRENNLQNCKPGDLSKRTAQRYFDELLVKRKVGNRTYNNYLTVLRTLFQSLVTRDYCDFNVFSKIPRLQTAESDIMCFTSTERKAVKESLPNDHLPLWCISQLVYYCYLRPAEIVRLRICDIDLDKQQIIVSGKQSKNKRSQVVVMPNALVKELKTLQLHIHPPHYYAFANYRQLTPGGTQTAPNRISEVWKEIVQQGYGIKKGIYLLKHTGAGEAFEAGIDARNIQLQIRHHSLEETQKYLDKFNNKAGKAFRQKMPVF